jgi:hypothetical protein
LRVLRVRALRVLRVLRQGLEGLEGLVSRVLGRLDGWGRAVGVVGCSQRCNKRRNKSRLPLGALVSVASRVLSEDYIT